MVLIRGDSGFALDLFIVPMLLEHSLLPRAIQNTIVSNYYLKNYSLECVVMQSSLQV
jgi:hypothetical protein